MIFKSDPSTALSKTRTKLDHVDENLASLRAKRSEVLLSSEDAGAVVAIDQAIEAEQRNAAIYKDRITALQEECRKVEYQSREAKRRRAIEKIKNRRCRGPNKAAADTAVECREAVRRAYEDRATKV